MRRKQQILKMPVGISADGKPVKVSEQRKDPGLGKSQLTVAEAPKDLKMGKEKMTF